MMAAALRLVLLAIVLVALVARGWVTNEIPLTLVYEQRSTDSGTYSTRVMSGAGGESVALTWRGQPVDLVDCSPDGTWLALMQFQQVLVMNGEGVAYERDLGEIYADFSIANDGSVTARSVSSRAWRVTETEMTPLTKPASSEVRYGPGRVAANGMSLTISEMGNLIVADAAGAVLWRVADVGKAEWLGDEQTAVLLDPLHTARRSRREYEHLLLDVTRGAVGRLDAPTRFLVYAPDGSRAAVGTPIESAGGEPLAVIDPFENRVMQVLAAEAGVRYTPTCWLTFMPQAVAGAG
jgi:hypothetical protein